MAGSFSDYEENKVLDHLFGGPDLVRPSTYYLAAFTVAPNDAGGGTEVSASGYARLAVTNNSTNFPSASAGVKSNGVAYEWPEAVANWGTVVAIGVFDALTGGNLRTWFDGIAVAINTGDSFRIKAGAMTITLD